MSLKDKTYWFISIIDSSGYKVDENTKNFIRAAIRNSGPGSSRDPFFEFTDIHGAEVSIVLDKISDWHESTPALRKEALLFKEELEKEKLREEWNT